MNTHQSQAPGQRTAREGLPAGGQQCPPSLSTWQLWNILRTVTDHGIVSKHGLSNNVSS